MSFCQTLNHLRRLKLFIPRAQSPLLTTYGRMMLPKLSPLKEKYQIYSKRKERVRFTNPQTQYLSANDINKLNRSYEAIKKSKGTDIKSKLKQTQYHLDPFYKTIHNLKQEALKKRAHSERRTNFGSQYESSVLSSKILSKPS